MSKQMIILIESISLGEGLVFHLKMLVFLEGREQCEHDVQRLHGVVVACVVDGDVQDVAGHSTVLV